PRSLHRCFDLCACKKVQVALDLPGESPAWHTIREFLASKVEARGYKGEFSYEENLCTFGQVATPGAVMGGHRRCERIGFGESPPKLVRPKLGGVPARTKSEAGGVVPKPYLCWGSARGTTPPSLSLGHPS